MSTLEIRMTLTGLSLWFCFTSVSDRGDLSTQFQYFIAIITNTQVGTLISIRMSLLEEPCFMFFRMFCTK